MDEKREARSLVRAGRSGRDGSREAFAERLADLVAGRAARRVTCFVSFGSEPDTSGFLAWALEHGVEVLLPRVLSDDEMEWAPLTEEPLVTGAFGIPEPQGPGRGHDGLAGVDLMLVPAAAVDRRGTRLGWGRGYFDRALASIHALATATAGTAPEVFAVVYESEVLDELPSEPHDRPVDGAVTEQRVHRFG